MRVSGAAHTQTYVRMFSFLLVFYHFTQQKYTPDGLRMALDAKTAKGGIFAHPKRGGACRGVAGAHRGTGGAGVVGGFGVSLFSGGADCTTVLVQ